MIVGQLARLGGYRELILNLVVRDVKEKYRGTVLGYFWTLVTPLVLTGIFVVIFTFLFPIHVPHYPLYLMIGFLSWNFFSSSLNDAVHSIRGGAELLKKVYFPAEIYPIASVMTNLVTFCLSLLVLVPLLASYRIPVGLRLLVLPGILLWQALLCLGMGLILSLSHVYFRDTGPLVSTGLNLWFYATPVFYTTAAMPPKVLGVYLLNPTAVLIELYRWAFMGRPAPGVPHLVFCGLVTVGLCVAGAALHARWGRHVTKVI